jgi:HD superfamily phosphohydrolase
MKFVLHLRQQKPELVDEKDVICVTLAGLCHDLGHGPFSHMYEDFLRKAGTDWHHETMSIKMLDYLIQDNNIMNVFMENDPALDGRDILFIKEMIAGMF